MLHGVGGGLNSKKERGKIEEKCETIFFLFCCIERIRGGGGGGV